jgi:DNA-binding response OmpR family regulator
MKILSLEDDHAQAVLIESALRGEGYDVHSFQRGANAIRYLKRETADLLVLDWMVPDISGLEVLAWVRQHLGWELPVLFLTCKPTENEAVMALHAGADDFMVKPLRRQELVGRVAALLRRVSPPGSPAETTLEAGQYVVNLCDRTVMLDGQVMDLSPREFDVVACLFRNLGRIMPRDAIIKLIWGHNNDIMSRSLDTHIYRIRQKLRIGPATGLKLQSVYTRGYRLMPVVTSVEVSAPSEFRAAEPIEL